MRHRGAGSRRRDAGGDEPLLGVDARGGVPEAGAHVLDEHGAPRSGPGSADELLRERLGLLLSRVDRRRCVAKAMSRGRREIILRGDKNKAIRIRFQWVSGGDMKGAEDTTT